MSCFPPSMPWIPAVITIITSTQHQAPSTSTGTIIIILSYSGVHACSGDKDCTCRSSAGSLVINIMPRQRPIFGTMPRTQDERVGVQSKTIPRSLPIFHMQALKYLSCRFSNLLHVVRMTTEILPDDTSTNQGSTRKLLLRKKSRTSELQAEVLIRHRKACGAQLTAEGYWGRCSTCFLGSMASSITGNTPFGG